MKYSEPQLCMSCTRREGKLTYTVRFGSPEAKHCIRCVAGKELESEIRTERGLNRSLDKALEWAGVM